MHNIRFAIPALCLAAIMALKPCSGAAGEENFPPQPAGEDKPLPRDKRPGLRMGAMIEAAAAVFMGGELPKGATIVPGLSVSGAQDGYTIRRYAVMKSENERAFYFFRVRTLVGTPERDVAAKFAADGTLENIFDLVPPPPPTEKADAGKAPVPAAAPPAAKAPGKDENTPSPEEIAALQKGPLPSMSVVMPLVGRHPGEDCEALAALLKGLARAEDIAKAGGEIKLPPLPANAFRIENPLPRIGTPLPKFKAVGLDGKPITNKSFRGRRVAYFFSAIDSIGCSDMNQIVSQWIATHPKESTRVVLILAEEEQRLKSLIKDTPLKGQGIICDPMADVAGAFKVEIRPMMLVYDRRHRIKTVITPDTMKNLDDLMKGF